MQAFAQVPLAGNWTLADLKMESGVKCSHIVAIRKGNTGKILKAYLS